MSTSAAKYLREVESEDVISLLMTSERDREPKAILTRYGNDRISLGDSTADAQRQDSGVYYPTRSKMSTSAAKYDMILMRRMRAQEWRLLWRTK